MPNVTHAPKKSRADQDLKRLQDGNRRYAVSQSMYSSPIAARVDTKVQERPTTAIIIACSDSAVSPEVIFDQEIGTLRVIEVGGNVLNNLILGSVESYARGVWHAPDHGFRA